MKVAAKNLDYEEAGNLRDRNQRNCAKEALWPSLK